MSIYTEICDPDSMVHRDSAVHQTVASATAWLSFKLCESKGRVGRFHGQELTQSERDTILALGRVQPLP